MELKTLLASDFALPSVPKVVALLLSELKRDEPDLKRITQLINTDPALTMRLLQLANAPAYRLSGKIVCVAESLALLSLSQVRTLTEAATSASFKALPGIKLSQFWAYSLNVAKLSRSLAGLVRENQQTAYSCGLIHAIGELTLHVGMPAELAVLNSEVAPLGVPRAAAETKSFGYCYAQVGAGLARQWLFPRSMVEALEHQCVPFEGDVYEPLAGVIHLATWRARAKEAGLSNKALADTFPGTVGDLLSLDIDMVLQQDPIDWLA